MEKLYSYSKIWENNIVVIIYIYWARAILILFSNHQDIEYE